MKNFFCKNYIEYCSTEILRLLRQCVTISAIAFFKKTNVQITTDMQNGEIGKSIPSF